MENFLKEKERDFLIELFLTTTQCKINSSKKVAHVIMIRLVLFEKKKCVSLFDCSSKEKKIR